MKLENISAEIRPRSSWEALDLGVQMARAWYKPLLLTWLAVSLPVFLVLLLLSLWLSWPSVWLVWWFKPLFERGLLHILSRALLGEVPTVKDTLRALPGWVKAQWFSSLTWRRLSLTRSFDLPVVQLENLGGSERSERLSVLHRQGAGGAVWLTTFCLAAEIAMAFGVYGLVILLVPSNFDINWWTVFGADLWIMNYLDGVVAFLCASLIAPFYVAAGFSLYINRRSNLEAWDVEIRFRSLLERVQQRSAKTPSRPGLQQVAFILLLGFCTALNPFVEASEVALSSDVNASVVEASQLPQSVVKEEIQAVLSGALFHEKVQKERIDFDWLTDLLETEEAAESESEWSKLFFEWLDKLAGFSSTLAGVLEIALWGLLVALVLIVALRYREWLSRVLKLQPSIVQQDKQTELLFGMDISPKSLPKNLLEQATLLGQRGEFRDAVSLFYRGALSQLNEQLSQQFKPALSSSDTEGECLGKIALVADENTLVFVQRLVGSWQRLAYGHLELSEQEFDRLREGWAQYFDAVSRNDVV